MKKVIFTAAAFGVASLFLSNTIALAEDSNDDAYEEAYYACSTKAESAEENYESVFESCMKMKGFATEEHEYSEDEENSESESE